MYKYERKDKCISPYSVNYKALYGNQNPVLDISSDEKKGKRFLGSSKNNKNQSRIFKLFLISLFLAAFSIAFVMAVGFFSCREDAVNLKKFDNIILPVVMQNPEPFNEKNPPSSQIVINSAVWDAAMNNQEVISDDLGRIILSKDEVNKSANRLFNVDIDFNGIENSKDNFYIFQPEKNDFLVSAISGTDNFVPHTVNFCKKGSEIILKVGYVVPANGFNSNMTLLSEDKIEKYMQYHLKKNKSTGKYFISAVL